MALLAKSFVPGFGQLGSKFRLFGVVQKGFDSSCKPKFYTHADKDPVLCIFQQRKEEGIYYNSCEKIMAQWNIQVR